MKFRPLPRLITVVLLTVILGHSPDPAIAQKEQEGATVHFLLKPLIDEPQQEIPAILKTELGGLQGRHSIGGREALSLHLRTDASPEELASLGARVRTWDEGRATIDILPERLAELARRPDVYSISLPRILQRILETSGPNTGVDHLRSESAGVFSGDTGAGVIVGIIDSGIDLDHANFQDPLGNTRLLFVLDQNTGIECTAANIDAGTCAQTDDGSGHGTHVTGIAAGNGAATNASGNVYETVGMAPEADIIAVKTSFASDDIEDAITYIFDKADTLGKPAVINLSLGGQLGAHDGTDSMEQHIDTEVLAQPGRAVVVAAGNDREAEIHAEVKTIHMTSVIGPEFEIRPYTVNPGLGNDLLAISGYYPQSDDLIVHLWTPTGDYLSQALVTGPADCNELDTASGYIWLCNNVNSILGQGTTSREIVVAVFDRNPNTGVASAPPGVGNWTVGLSGMTVAGGTGEADFWMFGTMRQNPPTSYPPHFTSHVDEEETLGIPATAEQAITVGAHNTKICWQDQGGNNRSYDGDFGIFALLSDVSWFSSWGPTRDGREKPDLTAPGAGIVSARASTANNPPFNINSNYLLMQGTSQAAPHVTGAVALLFEDTPSLTAAAVKATLRQETSESFFSHYTGPISGDWNPVFGEGLLDLAFLDNDPWETNDQLRHARRVLSGESIAGLIGEPGDQDHYQVHGMAPGDSLTAMLTSLPANYDLTLQAVWAIGVACNNSGPIPTVEASSTNGGTSSESATASLPTWVADYMLVEGVGGAFDAVNPYHLEGVISREELSTPHGLPTTAQELPLFVKFEVTGETSAMFDRDFYRFPVDELQTITAEVSPFSGAYQIEIWSPGPSSSLLASSLLGTVSYTVPAATGGDFHVNVTRIGGGGPIAYTLTLSVN